MHAVLKARELYGTGRWDQAEALCHGVLSVDPGHFDALCLLGVIAAQTRRGPLAADLLARAAAVNPSDAPTHNNLGNVLHELRRFEDALASYERALGLDPDFAGAHANRGNALLAMGRFDAAVSSYERALALRPEFVEAHYNLGNALQALRRHDAALACYDRALAIRPQFPEASASRGNVLQSLGRYEAAVASYDRALRVHPEFAEAHVNRANALQALGCMREALEGYERGLTLKPDSADAYYNRGNALRRVQRTQEACNSFRRALEIEPHHPWLYGSWLHAKMQLCDWQGLDEAIAELEARIERGECATPPFPLLSLVDSPSLHRLAAEIWAGAAAPQSTSLAPITERDITERDRPGRIRLGYFSGDFHGHAVASLVAGLLEQHDRRCFEVLAFSFGPDQEDEMRSRLRAGCDRFIEVRARSPIEIARLARELGIDIAVDLTGYTQNERAAIFPHRPAPVQVNFLGYPGTMGVPCFDYIVSDRTVIPDGSRRHYGEQVVYLPGSYQVNDRRRCNGESAPGRRELGLPENGFVFCCFNNLYKITPTTFDGWMRILRQVEGSVLWLLEDHPAAAANLRREAEARGVSRERLIFARRCRQPEHLARHAAADLFLDTLPYNAHTTASDALWTGLPVLTRTGASFASRVAASLLKAVGLPELVTATQEEFETLALALASDPPRISELRRRLQAQRMTAPLFDVALFTKRFETALTLMCERNRAGLPPAHIDVVRPDR